MPSILAQTKNLLDLYMHHVGETEDPRDYHFWSAVALISACVANRVSYSRNAASMLYPNLYVLLIGPSGVGKGSAISTAAKFIATNKNVNLYAGRGTAQHIIARMAQRVVDGVAQASGPIWLVHEELAHCIGVGDSAIQFMQMIVDLYSCRPYPWRDGTVGRGEKTLVDYCFNWLGGSTQEWFTEAVNRASAKTGFYGRIVPVFGEYNFDKRIPNPRLPDDYDVVVATLAERFTELSFLERSAFTITPDAKDVEENWYMTRPAPSDTDRVASWKRAQEMAQKLAMVFSLADSIDLVIRPNHMSMAIDWVEKIQQENARLLGDTRASAPPPEGEGVKLVREYISRVNYAPHAMLVRFAMDRGITRLKLIEIIDTLVQAKLVNRLSTQKGFYYSYSAKKKMPTDTDA